MRDAKTIKKIDFTLLGAVMVLALYGLLVLYGLSSKGETDFFTMQLIWFVIGIVFLAAVSIFSYTQIKHYIVPIYGGTIALLLLVMVLGKTTQGASRWLQIGFLRVQPSEFAKLIIIIALAAYLSERKGILKRTDLLRSGIIVFVPAFLIFRQPDLGTAIVLTVIWMGAILVSGVKPMHLAVIFLIGLLIIGFVLHFNVLKEYQKNRLTVFINPDQDIKGAGYNLLQSKIAIGSGGFFGKGLFSGSQTNLSFLPAANTDFIFSVLSEKMGFLGATFLIFLYFILLSRAVQIALTSDNYYGSLLALSIASMWLFQIFVNIGMTIGIMPITGIPLPFMSYGGSALLTNMVAAGILLNIHSRSIK